MWPVRYAASAQIRLGRSIDVLPPTVNGPIAPTLAPVNRRGPSSYVPVRYAASAQIRLGRSPSRATSSHVPPPSGLASSRPSPNPAYSTPRSTSRA